MDLLWYPSENAQMDSSELDGRRRRFVLLLPSVGSIRECSMGLPWYPSENAQMDASGPIPLSCAKNKIACWNYVQLKLTFGVFVPVRLLCGSTTRQWLRPIFNGMMAAQEANVFKR